MLVAMVVEVVKVVLFVVVLRKMTAMVEMKIRVQLGLAKVVLSVMMRVVTRVEVRALVMVKEVKVVVAVKTDQIQMELL